MRESESESKSENENENKSESKSNSNSNDLYHLLCPAIPHSILFKLIVCGLSGISNLIAWHLGSLHPD